MVTIVFDASQWNILNIILHTARHTVFLKLTACIDVLTENNRLKQINVMQTWHVIYWESLGILDMLS